VPTPPEPPPDELTTARLRLRRPTLADVEAVFAYASDPEVVPYVGWPRHRDRSDTLAFLRASMREFEEGGMTTYLAERLEDGRIIGSTGFVRDHGLQIGYVLARGFWRQGYATEMAHAMIDYAWTRPEVHRVWALTDVENVRSARVLEKAGMQREGVLRRFGVHPNLGSTPRDCVVYAKVREPSDKIR
jgi:ribosomal-protein-alanine N-acetyltransferase